MATSEFFRGRYSLSNYYRRTCTVVVTSRVAVILGESGLLPFEALSQDEIFVRPLQQGPGSK